MRLKSELPLPEMAIDSLLWRTRGSVWDYAFLLLPHAPAAADWFAIQSQVFGKLCPTPDEYWIAATLEFGRQRTPFLATAFKDETLHDAAGRAICHYIVWMRYGESAAEIRSRVPCNWGHQVIREMSQVLNAIFYSEGSFDDIEAEIAAARRGGPTRILFNGPFDSISHCSADIKAEAVGAGRSSLLSRESNRLSSIPEDVFRDQLEEAIKDGRLYALGYARNRFLPSSYFFRRSSSLPALAESFGGSPEDAFIQELYSHPEGDRSALFSYRSGLAPRGFDRLVDVLLPRFSALGPPYTDEDRLHQEVAALIGHGASSLDRIVHNLVVRLRAIAS